jgi:hypothetical protein
MRGRTLSAACVLQYSLFVSASHLEDEMPLRLLSGERRVFFVPFAPLSSERTHGKPVLTGTVCGKRES